ncbi:MAG: GNAT family N-acetyltransferase [Polyangiaceae bacterium]
MEVIIRDAIDADSEGILAVLKAVFAEYEGCVYEPSEMPELERPATSFAEMHGRLWVVELDGSISGCIGMAEDHDDPSLVELKKLYLLSSLRGRGLGRRLIELVEQETRARGLCRIHLWSDTRFTTAHGVYERCGYTKLAETRELHDLSFTVEYHFEKTLTP